MKFKNGLLCLVFMLIFISSMVYAGEGDYLGFSSGEDGKPYGKAKLTLEPGVYKFSKALIKATETCTPYEEDIYNKEAMKKATFVPISGYLVQIKGKTKKGNCKLQLVPVSLFGVGFYKCVITPEQQAKLVAAMKSKSNKTIYKIIKYEQKLGKNAKAKGMEPSKGELDITGDEFTVLINEISQKTCVTEFE